MTAQSIAIIGMAGRFPQDLDVRGLWTRLLEGGESVRRFATEELVAAGVPDAVAADPRYVAWGADLPGADRFDAGFFGIPSGEARLIDPQQRIFLECAWTALEDAAVLPTDHGGRIGVFGSVGATRYLKHLDHESSFPVRVGTGPDYLATRVSFRLDLRGPSMTVQSACSSSLAAVDAACQALITSRCDVALAGGVSLRSAQGAGYLYEEGGAFSRDGHCRPFDARASGMVPGNGCGIVVLKRLADALADGDHIYAVIAASGTNNDGAHKMGYLAPSVAGQAQLIRQCLDRSGVAPEDVGYIEAHGTGTHLGDPIEVAALRSVYDARTASAEKCGLGSVKANIGHLDAAAGVTGLIKTALILRHQIIPPQINFDTPNPGLRLADSPFTIHTEAYRPAAPLRAAAVNSLGLGGTNAHCVLTAPPATQTRMKAESGPERVLLTVSAKSPTALSATAAGLGRHLQNTPDIDLSAVGHTLRTGRTPMPYRAAFLCRDRDEAAEVLLAAGAEPVADRAVTDRAVFMFAGAGSQYPGMGRGLYAADPVFRAEIDRCEAILKGTVGLDLQAALDGTGQEGVPHVFAAIVATEYAMARTLISYGVRPAALIGHSLGEYVAACLAGVFRLEDVLPLVVERERLMLSAAGTGAMLGVPLDELSARQFLTPGLSLAAVNGPSHCTLSGPAGEIEALAATLARDGIDSHQVRLSMGAHSALLDPVLDTFAEAVAEITLGEPDIPFISCLTGTWITSEQALSPRYWADQMRSTVRFASGIERLGEELAPLLIEVGPGNALTTVVGRAAGARPTMRHPNSTQSDVAFLHEALGDLWQRGADVDWHAMNADGRPQTVPLPGYAFQRERYWTEAEPAPAPVDPDPMRWTASHLYEAFPSDRRLQELAEATMMSADTLQQLDRLCLLHVCKFLCDSGVTAAEGSVHSLADLTARLCPAPKYQKFFRALLGILEDSGVAVIEGGLLRFVVDAGSLEDAWPGHQRFVAAHPELEYLLEMLDRCVRSLGPVFQGEIEGLQAALPDGKDTLHQQASRTRRINSLAAHFDLVATTVARLVREAGGRTVRILEIGAGRGYISKAVIDALPDPSTVEYHFTDIGRSFVLDAQKQAQEDGLGCMRFGTLDISEDPAAQGYDPGTFDIILAFNVLHATRDLRVSLRNTQRLLTQDGLLFLVEISQLDRASLLTTGFFDGWWYYDDGIRVDSPLLPPREWADLFAKEGFRDLATFPADPDTPPFADHCVIVGKRPLESHHDTSSPAATQDIAPYPARTASSPSFNRRPDLTVAYAPAHDSAEQQIAEIWKEALGLDRVGRHDNFFDLGGESLLALQIIAEINARTGAALALKTLWQNPTVAGLSAAILAGEGAKC
ncbi:acyltransferase domain-containing protein [Streptomyces sp. SKN60]|uniref:type I polyketide synthase n=1 Tax=Streptomyces sp. SKN60 TaxID=2855506 RepID=UPI002247EB96|nr:beta-ketoacyl synthase N-terminal-like domain-containing protein [Streptomyces sp. SKN60]MCX2185013.1 acyltransferase domain-containing protein [Streptomyces sp. SKN60]